MGLLRYVRECVIHPKSLEAFNREEITDFCVEKFSLSAELKTEEGGSVYLKSYCYNQDRR